MKFIEWDLPLAEISKQSAKEKNIRHGHPSTLQIWWARKPLASSRAVNVASLLDYQEESSKNKEIKDLITSITPWKAVNGGNSQKIREVREKINNQYDGPPKVLDPFAGGGAIPLEALRLGCETYSSDYNPVAVFIEKATIEWPKKYGFSINIPIKKASERELKNSGYSEKEINDIKKGNKSSLLEKEFIGVNLLSHLVEKWSDKILKEAKEEIGEFYPDKSSENLVGGREVSEKEGWIPVGYIWARTIPCNNPSCGAEVPLLNQFWLSRKKNKQIAYKPLVDQENDVIDYEILRGKRLEKAIEDGFDPSDGTVSKANAECPVCGQVTESEKVKRLSQKGKMGEELIALVLHHPNETGKKYRLAKSKDKEVFEEAENYLETKISNWNFLESPLPDEEILTPNGKEYQPGEVYYNFTPVVLYGMTKWKDLFNNRQKLALLTFLEKIKSNRNQIIEDCKKYAENISADIKDYEGLAKAVSGYLTLVLGRLADKNANIVVWNPYGEKIEHVFGRQALRMTWGYIELNVFSGVNGDWTSNLNWVLRFIENTELDVDTPVSVKQESATSLEYEDNSFDAVLTDPPYYDNIPYSDLSNFFYVWFKRAVGDIFPELFSTPHTSKSEEIIAELPLLRGMNKEKASESISGVKTSEHFEFMLGKSFKEIYRVLKPNGIAVIVYAHKSTEGWETLLNSLVNSGFVLTASWPVHTERTGRLRAQASATLASSIYMVCRKKERKNIGFWKNIKSEIREKVRKKLQQFWEEGIVGGDFFISAIGPGMEIYSQYERVEDYSGDQVDTKDLLEFIRSITTGFIVNRLLEDASSERIDEESQFYLAYRWTYLDNKVVFDGARRIASGIGIELENLAKDGFVKKTRKYIQVLGPVERNGIEEINSMVDVMHKCLLLWEEGKKDKIDELLSKTGYGKENSFWQFCQAVSESLTQGKKEKQLLEGFLVGKEKYTESSHEAGQKGLDEYGGE